MNRMLLAKMPRHLALPVAGFVVVAGVAVVWRIFAAGLAASYLLPDAALTSGASVVSNSSAIGGRMVQFGSVATPTPAPTATPTPTPTPSGTSCALPKYPTPDCTGVPAGTVLSALALNDGGAYRVTTAGAVIDGKHIAGDLLITANNVVVKNSQIDGTVINEYGTTHYSFTISDSTIGPSSGCVVRPGLGESDFTATRIYVRNHDDGFRMSGNNVSISDSYAKLCYAPPAQAPPDGSHSDGIQSYCPDQACSGLVFNHNTVDARGIPATFMINLVDPNLSTVSVTNNLLGGGAYVIVPQWHSGSVWTIGNNRVINNSWTYGPASAEGTCSHQSWSGNSIVTVDSAYNITSTVSALGCVN